MSTTVENPTDIYHCQSHLRLEILKFSNTENQRDATITIYWSPRSAQHVSGKLLPIFRSARLRFFTAYGIVSFCCGRQGFGAHKQQDSIPYAVKKPHSCAPEDGQKFARNMLSWSWRSINCYCCVSLVFYITLPTMMMQGQTQIKY